MLLTMESKSNAPDTMSIAIPSNSGGISKNPQDPGQTTRCYNGILTVQDTMMDLADSYNDSMTEDEILAKALGERSGYQKGLGYGVEVPRRNASWTTSQEDSTIHEKLSETTRNLESANGSIQTLTMELEEEKSKRKEYEVKLEEFQTQMLKMQQMMEMMQTERNGI